MTKGKSKKKRFVKITIISIAVAVIVMVLFVVFKFLPLGMPDGKDYFKPLGERVLLEDEQGQWNYIKNEYGSLEATGDTFAGWDETMGSYWRYAIAFTAYSMPALKLIDPDNTDMIEYINWVMINKMKSKKVWKDWEESGFGEDPIGYGNIMYKGHLNLMYGLYQLMSGDDRFAREYTWLTQQLIKEIRDHHEAGVYEGVDCEPNRYFVQCNSIGLMSLLIYDKLYGTNYTENETQWILGFFHEKMTDPDTGLYWALYHPSHDTADRYLSGYTNAWAIVFLRPLEPEYNEGLYEKWKEVFVHEMGPYAYVSEIPEGGPSGMATMFGMWAAKEYGDVKLFTKIRNAIDKNGHLVMVPESGEMKYEDLDNPLFNGPILAIKLHIPWDTILNYDWGHETPLDIPDVSDMTWKDLLPQEIHELETPLEGELM